MHELSDEFETGQHHPAVFVVVVFFTRIYLQYIARPVESDRPLNIVIVRPSVFP